MTTEETNSLKYVLDEKGNKILPGFGLTESCFDCELEYALDEKGNKILPDLGLRATCPDCGTEVIAICGNKNKYHWRHNYTYDSHKDKWYKEMTPWHLRWQELFPVECREVVIKKGRVVHRADVKINNLIIEFQHTDLKRHNVKKRELFYGSYPDKIIWVIDGTANRVFNVGKKKLNPENLKPVFLVDKESNIYFETEGYINITLIRNVDELTIGLVINPEYPTFVDLGEYIACPLEKLLCDITGIVYSKHWGNRKKQSKRLTLISDLDGFYGQEFILIKKNDFIKMIYNIPTELDSFKSLTICDQQALEIRKDIKRKKEESIRNMKLDFKKYGNYTTDELEKEFQEKFVNNPKLKKKYLEGLKKVYYLH
ncbi:MAG TPA: hypothetical protein VE956_07225 [Nodularia sp. (in: cyanobacteria)]|nr:hypothetical protein [Nodularia sp. (in: cyanobacteria)]